jgi:hypothetical protein
MRRFNSKVDRWLLVVMIISLVLDLAAMVVVIVTVPEVIVLTVTVVVLLLAAALIGSILISTYYTVDKTTLKIVSGPLRFRVNLDDINSVRATRNPLSSPALSLDRLMINYGKNRKVMVSPADKRGFLKAIGQELEKSK